MIVITITPIKNWQIMKVQQIKYYKRLTNLMVIMNVPTFIKI